VKIIGRVAQVLAKSTIIECSWTGQMLWAAPRTKLSSTAAMNMKKTALGTEIWKLAHNKKTILKIPLLILSILN
jgi:hypothetical protein